MPNNSVAGQPGILSERVATPRRILFGGKADGTLLFFPGGVTIDGDLSRDLGQSSVDQGVLRAGKLMGKVSADGKYAPAIIGELNGAYTGAESEIDVGVAIATEIVRTGVTTISLVGPEVADTAPVNTEIATIISVDTGAGTVDITGTELTNDFIVGSWVGLGNGAEVPRMLCEDEYGVRVTDRDAVSVDVDWSRCLNAGTLDVGQIVDYPTDVALIEFLKDTLRQTTRGLFQFSDDYIDV